MGPMVTVNYFHKFYHDTDLVPDWSMINNLTQPTLMEVIQYGLWNLIMVYQVSLVLGRGW